MGNLLFKGLVIGILVSAPMGPIGILCIQRTLNKGRWHGFTTGLGAALSDIIYALITCLGMGMVVSFVEANEAPLQLIGSLVLAVFGYYTYKSNPTKNLQKNKEGKISSSYTQDFITAFLLTLSNVFIILLYIALFARFGFILPEHSVYLIAAGIVCIGLGAILWWFIVTYFIAKLKTKFNVRGLLIFNRVIGVILIGVSCFGGLTVLLSHYFKLTIN
jgi:threonine/homoserine/homoserine lactone efflux protein